MNRRGFLSTLAAVTATAVLDPEKLLWRPGAKLISIPRPRLPYHRFEFDTLYPLAFGEEGSFVVTPLQQEIFDQVAARMAAAIDAEFVERYVAQYEKTFIQGIQWGARPDGSPKLSLLTDVYRRNRSH